VPSGAEADPVALFGAAAAAARDALDRAPAGGVAGIGVASMAETGVLLGERGEVLAPAIAWHDARGADEALAIAVDLGDGVFEERTGLPVTPLCTLAKLRWLLAYHEPARRARRWLNVSEWVVRRLGGRDVSELSLASRTGMLDLAERAPYSDALASSGLPDGLLGEVVVAGTACGTANGDAVPSAEGAVLTVAGHDHPVAGVGVGVVAPGDVLDSCGTAEALVRIAPPLAPADVPRCVANGITVGWHVGPDRHALLGSAWTGLALSEVLSALGVARAEVDAEALAVEDAPELELDLHSLERRPVRLPESPPGAVWRAAIETCEKEIWAILDRMAAVVGPHERVVVTGGWSRDAAVMLVKSALGAVHATPVVESGARGAALLAGVAAGVYSGIDALPAIDGERVLAEKGV
jgi:sugar (pentulose or hexulose) kinase